MPSTSFNTIPYDMHKLDVTTNTHGAGSTTSVEISHDMFAPSNNPSPVGSKGPSPQTSNSHFRPPANAENFNKKDVMMVREVSQNHRRLQHPPHHTHFRSASAQPPNRQEVGHRAPEHSNSMEYVGMEKQRQHSYHQQELPNLEDRKVKS